MHPDLVTCQSYQISISSASKLHLDSMSAYGSIRGPELPNALPCKLWRLTATASDSGYVTTHHLTLSSANQLGGLLEHLSAAFAEEVKSGLTYPQEGEMDQHSFENYFFAADVFVAIIGARTSADGLEPEIELDIDTARAGRRWDKCVAGFYYVGVAIQRIAPDAKIRMYRSNPTTLDALHM
jgi:hypothetical protein